MGTIETLVRSAMTNEAETMTMAPQLRAGIDQRARRYRVRRTTTVGASALAVLAVAVGVPLVRVNRADRADRAAPAAVATPASDFTSWTARGDLANNTAFVQSAVQAWAVDDRDPEPLLHTDIHVLWAGRLATGRAAVLLGTDPNGVRRLGVIGGAGRELSTMRDVRAPLTLTHLSFNLFTDDESRTTAGYHDALVVVLAPGSTNRVRWFGSLADGSAGSASPESAAVDGIAVIDISAAGPRQQPTIQILGADGQVVYDGPIGTIS